MLASLAGPGELFACDKRIAFATHRCRGIWEREFDQAALFSLRKCAANPRLLTVGP
jgi:hypothetical protein